MSDFMEKLADLRKRHPSDITESDRAFLQARRSYLSEHEKIAFGIADEAEPVADGESAEETKPLKKPKAKAKDEAEPVA